MSGIGLQAGPTPASQGSRPSVQGRSGLHADHHTGLQDEPKITRTSQVMEEPALCGDGELA